MMLLKKLLNTFAKQEERHVEYGGTLRTVGSVMETFGVQGVAQLTADIAKKQTSTWRACVCMWCAI